MDLVEAIAMCGQGVCLALIGDGPFRPHSSNGVPGLASIRGSPSCRPVRGGTAGVHERH